MAGNEGGVYICQRPFAAPAGVFRFLKRLPSADPCPAGGVSSVGSVGSSLSPKIFSRSSNLISGNGAFHWGFAHFEDGVEEGPASVAVLTSFGLESPCSIGSFFFTFIGISPGSYISPRPGFRLFFRSLKERLSSSKGASASRFKLLSLSSAGGVGSDEDDASTGAWGGVIICHSPATPWDRRSSSCAAIRSASGSS